MNKYLLTLLSIVFLVTGIRSQDTIYFKNHGDFVRRTTPARMREYYADPHYNFALYEKKSLRKKSEPDTILAPAALCIFRDSVGGVQYLNGHGYLGQYHILWGGKEVEVLLSDGNFKDFKKDARKWFKHIEQVVISKINMVPVTDDTGTAEVTGPNDPMLSQCWWYTKLNLQDAWDQLPTDAPHIKIATVEGSGFPFNHMDLELPVATRNSVDFNSDVSITSIYDKHPACTAGINGAKTNNAIGVPSVTNNLADQVWCRIGYGVTEGGSFYVPSSAYPDMFNFCYTLRVKVINVSLGGSSSSVATQAAITKFVTPDLSIGYLGGVINASTGNDNLTNKANQFPCNYNGVNGIGASTSTDAQASYSNDGEYLEYTSAGSGIVTIDVPGGPGYSSTDYTSFSGTSAASPTKSGIDVLVYAANPILTSTQENLIVAQSCRKVGTIPYTTSSTHPLGPWNSTYGYGIPDADLAVYLAINTTPPPPPIDIPNLFTYNCTATPTVFKGQPVTINSEVWTSHPEISGQDFVTEIRWSNNSTFSLDDTLIARYSTSLGNGVMSQGYDLQWTPQASGYVVTKADVSGEIEESSETDNTCNPPPYVTVIQPNPVGLNVDLVSMNPVRLMSNGLPTQYVQIHFVFTNTGSINFTGIDIQHHLTTSLYWTSTNFSLTSYPVKPGQTIPYRNANYVLIYDKTVTVIVPVGTTRTFEVRVLRLTDQTGTKFYKVTGSTTAYWDTASIVISS